MSRKQLTLTGALAALVIAVLLLWKMDFFGKGADPAGDMYAAFGQSEAQVTKLLGKPDYDGRKVMGTAPVLPPGKDFEIGHATRDGHRWRPQFSEGKATRVYELVGN